MPPATPVLGACSWSLCPAGPEALVRDLAAVGVSAVQLALDPLRTGAWDPARTADALASAGVAARSGMMATAGEDYATLESIRATGGLRPDRHWPANLEAARENARLARRLDLPLVTLHAGFLPEDPDDPERATLLERLRLLADAFADEGVDVALETGQESAATLAAFLDALDHPRVGVNFDPANMLLYGMGDPVDAMRALAPRVRQVHLKDARRAPVPGTWGEEVPLGDGEVDWEGFFGVLHETELGVDLMVEREAGEDRVADMRRALDLARTRLA